MSEPDAVPLPREGEVFFDVRGDARAMRLSWYGDTRVAVFSIWQGNRCSGTFRLPFAELAKMVQVLQSGPQPRQQADYADPRYAAGGARRDSAGGHGDPLGIGQVRGPGAAHGDGAARGHGGRVHSRPEHGGPGYGVPGGGGPGYGVPGGGGPGYGVPGGGGPGYGAPAVPAASGYGAPSLRPPGYDPPGSPGDGAHGAPGGYPGHPGPPGMAGATGLSWRPSSPADRGARFDAYDEATTGLRQAAPAYTPRGDGQWMAAPAFRQSQPGGPAGHDSGTDTSLLGYPPAPAGNAPADRETASTYYPGP